MTDSILNTCGAGYSSDPIVLATQCWATHAEAVRPPQPPAVHGPPQNRAGKLIDSPQYINLQGENDFSYLAHEWLILL
jgi:hypothetical protein